jgi:hypothetical protein
VKTFDSNRLAGTVTIAEINMGKTARHDLALNLEILRIDLSLRESFCNHRLVENLRLLASSRPVSFPD